MNLKENSGILPLGFKASGVSAQIKKSDKKDLALIYSSAPCVASAMFTSNKIVAAPVEVSKKHLKGLNIHAVVVNSGNANCMTGMRGIEDSLRTARCVAGKLSLKDKEVLVASTGIIGKPLPMDKIEAAIPDLTASLSDKGLSEAAQAILTTDTFPKEVCAKFKVGGKTITISGIAKGAGMIAPKLNMGTMLAFILTDAAITRPALDRALKSSVEESFNAITIDGCMSTNDTVCVLANGEAGNDIVRENTQDEKAFTEALREVCLELAKMIVRDAEGATKFIEVHVRGARNGAQARDLAFSVANSNLFKCAMFGNDPNWGRIAAALGSVPSELDWQKLDIAINKKAVFKNGKPQEVKDDGFLKGKVVVVEIDLNAGDAEQRVYTSDLSYDYVRINAEYN